MNESSEKAIWLLFVEGDLNAFSTLFKLFYDPLHNYGLKISSNSEITEDCLQNFFIYLYDNRTTFGTVKHVKSYLFVSFRRALLKSLKKERKYTDLNLAQENSTAFEFSSEELMVKQELTKIRKEAVAILLNSLSTREREAIYLKYYSELPTNRISEVMDISYQSVLNTLQKAFTKLRHHLEKHEIKQVFNLN
ncbi:sigma-70 family RNA polymerase sigma factor [Aurantibacter crassamenti]|uniref:RNA polymerase sigma factor n=1 Tax=Aurantibacter crassamenti TaxID=1837375 RepID=UPI00193A5D5E|nr:sigma-70 family RNA polymerase sigma factor [Aurantibacter crassamenti]MBM1106910.1 sigma-70 family RNA polymerase sigma factor [Aurantibacter crassamenti]